MQARSVELAMRYNVPETGLTTFTMGVLLDHMSEFVVGPLSSDAGTSELLPLTADEYETGPERAGAFASAVFKMESFVAAGEFSAPNCVTK